MVQDLVVLGGGSAGFLAAITLKTQLPQPKIMLLRSPHVGIIGVGEGTMPVVLTLLHG
jgi:tryptophan halogenase